MRLNVLSHVERGQSQESDDVIVAIVDVLKALLKLSLKSVPRVSRVLSISD